MAHLWYMSNEGHNWLSALVADPCRPYYTNLFYWPYIFGNYLADGFMYTVIAQCVFGPTVLDRWPTPKLPGATRPLWIVQC